MKLERDAKELQRRIGHLPIAFPEYDSWAVGLLGGSWEELPTVPYEMDARQVLTFYARKSHVRAPNEAYSCKLERAATPCGGWVIGCCTNLYCVVCMV